jgi:hypothetical protein
MHFDDEYLTTEVAVSDNFGLSQSISFIISSRPPHRLAFY